MIEEEEGEGRNQGGANERWEGEVEGTGKEGKGRERGEGVYV